MFEAIPLLLSARRHPHLLGRRRAEVILARVAVFATVAAVCTVAWIAVDAAMIAAPWWKDIAAWRIAAGAAFAALALACRRAPRSLRYAQVSLAALFTIPLVFFIAAQPALRGARLEGLAQGVEVAYSFVPFMLACGIAAFPLTALESAALAAAAFAGEAWFLSFQGQLLPLFTGPDAFWLLFLVAGAGAFAAMSQVNLVMALVAQAIRDPLTGCLRRESGLELLELQLGLAARRKAPLAVMFADLDRFKAVNDAFGHEAGDRVLAAAAEGLRAEIRESDAVVRWGGEEFLVMMPDATAADAVGCIERWRLHGVGAAPDGRPVTLSIGIAERLRDGEPDARRLVALADARMYAAKQAGRNRYVSEGGPEAAVPILPETSTSAR